MQKFWSNGPVLGYLRALAASGAVRPGAEAVIMFDLTQWRKCLIDDDRPATAQQFASVREMHTLTLTIYDYSSLTYSLALKAGGVPLVP